MPTYQYACTECGEQLEMVQKFSDDPLTVCPACSGRLRKVFSPVGIVFKGSGFYRTDSRAGNGAKDGAKDGKASRAPRAPAPRPTAPATRATRSPPPLPPSSSSSSSSRRTRPPGSSSGTSSGSTSEKVA